MIPIWLNGLWFQEEFKNSRLQQYRDVVAKSDDISMVDLNKGEWSSHFANVQKGSLRTALIGSYVEIRIVVKVACRRKPNAKTFISGRPFASINMAFPVNRQRAKGNMKQVYGLFVRKIMFDVEGGLAQNIIKAIGDKVMGNGNASCLQFDSDPNPEESLIVTLKSVKRLFIFFVYGLILCCLALTLDIVLGICNRNRVVVDSMAVQDESRDESAEDQCYEPSTRAHNLDAEETGGMWIPYRSLTSDIKAIDGVEGQSWASTIVSTKIAIPKGKIRSININP